MTDYFRDFRGKLTLEYSATPTLTKGTRRAIGTGLQALYASVLNEEPAGRLAELMGLLRDANPPAAVLTADDIWQDDQGGSLARLPAEPLPEFMIRKN